MHLQKKLCDSSLFKIGDKGDAENTHSYSTLTMSSLSLSDGHQARITRPGPEERRESVFAMPVM